MDFVERQSRNMSTPAISLLPEGEATPVHDVSGQLARTSLPAPQDLELDLFIPAQIKSERRVRFHVQRREPWTPNSTLWDYREQE